MKHLATPALLAAIALVSSDAGAAPPRPRILGISHVAFRASDLARAQAFYGGLLGFFAEARPARDGSPARLLVSVNDRQYLEILSGLAPDQDRLDHMAFETDD